MKDYRKIVYALIAVAAVNLIAMACLFPSLPEQIPVHFNYKFEVDQMGTPLFLLVFPAITLVFAVSIAVEQKIRGKDYANNKALTFFAIAFVALFIVQGWTLYAMCSTTTQLGDKTTVPLDLIIGLGMSILFIILGNYIPTLQQNCSFGIKTYSTLTNAEIWRKVHRFGGKYFVLGGIFSAVMTLVGHFSGTVCLVFAGLMAGIFGPVVIIMVYIRKIAKQ